MTTLIKPADRRTILHAGLAGIAATLAATPALAEGIIDKAENAVGIKPEDVTPPEDLMREHGVLDRVLLIYEAALRKLANNEDFDPQVIADGAKVVQDFIENYHEKSEEQFLFPRFRKAQQLVDLCGTLLEQHRAGRRVTATVLQYAPRSRQDDDARRRGDGVHHHVPAARRARGHRPVSGAAQDRVGARVRCHRRGDGEAGAPALRRGRFREDRGPCRGAGEDDRNWRSAPVHAEGRGGHERTRAVSGAERPAVRHAAP
jgi:hypothetical protein